MTLTSSLKTATALPLNALQWLLPTEVIFSGRSVHLIKLITGTRYCYFLCVSLFFIFHVLYLWLIFSFVLFISSCRPRNWHMADVSVCQHVSCCCYFLTILRNTQSSDMQTLCAAVQTGKQLQTFGSITVSSSSGSPSYSLAPVAAIFRSDGYWKHCLQFYELEEISGGSQW